MYFIKTNIRFLSIFLIIAIVSIAIINENIGSKDEKQVVAKEKLLSDYEIKKIELELKKMNRN